LPAGKLDATAGVGNELPTLHALLFFLVFLVVIVVGDDIHRGFGYFEWHFGDFDTGVDSVADDEAEASR
jgi:hypothetical protein